MLGLILVRGLPGSGKSTLAKRLAMNLGHVHFEADQYFMLDGRYNFDASKLGLAHHWCQTQTHRCLTQGMTVVVSNTFTTVKELAPYFELAKEFSILPQVIVCQGEFGNIHNVPEETLNRMRQRWAWDIGALYDKPQQEQL